MSNEIKKVAAGLRTIKGALPDAFLFLSDGDECFDCENILGLDVFNVASANIGYGYQDHSVKFFPIWKDTLNHDLDIVRFRNAYFECGD